MFPKIIIHPFTCFTKPKCFCLFTLDLFQIFLVCGVYLTQKMAMVNMPSEQFLEQRKQLWGVILAFETEAIISIVYDVLLFTIGEGYWGCGGFLYQHNILSVVTFIVVRSVRLFGAVWVMLYMYDAQSTEYAEPPSYTYEPEDSLDRYMAERSESIVPYVPETAYPDIREPLLSENTFENYLKYDEGARFGESTNNKLLIQATNDNLNTV